MNILIKNVSFDNRKVNVSIKGNVIHSIEDAVLEFESVSYDKIIEGKGKALIPGLINTHTHAAMTLFRGFGDDMKLMPWLEQKIWPNEAKMTEEDVYWGAKLACLEMIKTGTTTFLDMYQKFHSTARAVEEMGIRGVLSGVCFDHFNAGLREQAKTQIIQLFSEINTYGDRIRFSLGPHAIYTVSGELLKWLNHFSEEHDLLIHLHLAETEGEVADSVRQFGHTPVRYLDELGVLSSRLLIAHGLYVDDDEIRILSDRGVKVAHNPASNMKLASGMQFKLLEMQKAGVTVGIGTDGCASSNNLDMIEAMKLASLSGKAWRKDPEVLTAGEMLKAATENGARIAGINAGRIEKGMLADLCLIDLNIPAFTPNFNFVSNLVYAANGSCVDTVICDGKVLMENKKVPEEDYIMEKAARIAYDLIKR